MTPPSAMLTLAAVAQHFAPLSNVRHAFLTITWTDCRRSPGDPIRASSRLQLRSVLAYDVIFARVSVADCWVTLSIFLCSVVTALSQASSSAVMGGTVVVVGMPSKGSTLTIETWGFINEKTIKGCFLGSARIEEDIPRLIDLYAAGELLLDELVTDRISLSDLPAALERLRRGDVVRQLVVF